MDENRNKEGNKAAIVAIISNIVLTALNITVGYISGSYALIAEGFHTFSDILTTIIAFAGFKVGQKPSDEEHLMGHGRAEAIAGLIILMFLVIIGWEIIVNAIEKIINPNLITVPDYYAALIAVVGIILNIAVSRYIIGIGKKIDSPAIEADGHHQKTDIYSSIAILISILVANMGYPMLDPIVGIIIGLLIMKTAFEIGKDNINNILGKVPKDIIREIEEVANNTPNAYEAHNIKVDNYGPYYVVFLHIKVNGDLSVNESHKIAHEVEQNVLKIDKIKSVSVHTCPLGLEYEHKQEIDN
ncbi:cation diffusion facilitator family transporter [uncultured Methanobrevibacter sp.]|uniref:cation diffusion facilitator family transporter n=1 Tax=uncultured Methanobrevibacter sp. TaxID=253161 RepID=UPI0025ED4F2F|nr:cation diffusion facilitator family transporter [uncultured Methanobrevibacter sp.]